MVELLSKTYKVFSIDKEGTQYSKISRLHLKGDNLIELDYVNHLLNISEEETLSIKLYKGHVNDEEIPKEYSYAMYGHCYQVSGDEISISFGGLLMLIKGTTVGIEEEDEITIACKRL